MAMSDESKNREQRDVEMLLPFYATGRLMPSDIVQVEQYLSDHPDRLRLVSQEQDAVVAGNEAIVAGRAHNFARVAARISATHDRPANRGAGVLSAIWRFFQMPSTQSVRWVSAAAAVLIVLQGAAIGMLAVTRYSQEFATASGEAASREPGTFATVRFADGATAPAIAAMLAGLDMRVVDGPVGGGLFTVRIGPKGMSKADRDRAIASLRARSDLVAFVARLQ
jgi:hypothetical protein